MVTPDQVVTARAADLVVLRAVSLMLPRVDGQHMDVGPLLAGRGPGVELAPGGPHGIMVAPSGDVSRSFNLGLVVFEAVD